MPQNIGEVFPFIVTLKHILLKTLKMIMSIGSIAWLFILIGYYWYWKVNLFFPIAALYCFISLDVTIYLQTPEYQPLLSIEEAPLSDFQSSFSCGIHTIMPFNSHIAVTWTLITVLQLGNRFILCCFFFNKIHKIHRLVHHLFDLSGFNTVQRKEYANHQK